MATKGVQADRGLESPNVSNFESINMDLLCPSEVKNVVSEKWCLIFGGESVCLYV